jgi:predicted methyltransferase
MLERIRQALRPGGRLLLIEPTSAKLEGKPRAEQEKEHVIAAGIVAEDLRAAGFEIVVRNDAFTQAQGEERAMWLILARRPTDEK